MEITMIPPQRLLLTRTETGNAKWAKALEKMGHIPIPFPCIRTQYRDLSPLKGPLQAALSAADHLIFTSAKGVDGIMRDPSIANAFITAAAKREDLRLAAVGPATAAAVQSAFSRCDFKAQGGTGAALAQELIECQTSKGRVLVLAAAQANREMDYHFQAAGWPIQRFELYDTQPMPADAPPKPLPTVDYILLASPSAVAGLLGQIPGAIPTPVICLGPSTKRAAHAAQLTIAGQAKTRTLDALIDAIEMHIGETHGQR